jgi:hypothetical protein
MAIDTDGDVVLGIDPSFDSYERQETRLLALEYARDLRPSSAPTLEELLADAERIYEWLVQ